MDIFNVTPRERIERGPIKIDNAHALRHTERQVYKSDPEEIIYFLNKYDKEADFDSRDERQYGPAQEILVAILTT